MLLKFFYDERLAHASYLVGCQATGEAIVIDPGRNVHAYLAASQRERVKIVAATETHIHADFVSGARELAAATGARLYLSDEGGPDWRYQFAAEQDCVLLKHGSTWNIGNIRFEALHTPGHTPEHLCYQLTDTAAADKPMGLFSGDFIFVGDVGRPDLLETAAGVKGAKEMGARDLFQSLQKFRTLPDYLQVWPAHGAGSACGKALGAVPSTTLGYEKMFNWAFAITDEHEFVRESLRGQNEPPRYFAQMKKINKQGPPIIGQPESIRRFEVEKLRQLLREQAWIVDTRPMLAYSRGHIPGTVSIPLTKSFSTHAGWVLPYDQELYIIASEEKVDEVVAALRYIGLDQIGGWFSPAVLQDWAQAAQEPLQQLRLASVQEVAGRVVAGSLPIIDVRTPAEFKDGRPVHAVNICLGDVDAKYEQIPADKPVVVSCLGGGRSFVAASLLQRRSRIQVINLVGGFEAWRLAGQPVEQ